jgi:hypothetical protein
MANFRQALGGMLQGASQELQRKRQAQQELESEMQKLMMQEEIKSKFGEWKPQSQEEAIEYERAKKSSPGYERTYIVNPEGGYELIEFPHGKPGRVMTDRAVSGRTEEQYNDIPMWTQWLQGVPIPTKDGVIDPPKTKEEAYSRMLISGADMMNPEIMQILEQLPSQKDAVVGEEVGEWSLRRMLPGVGYPRDRQIIPRKYPEIPQRTQVNYPRPQTQRPQYEINKAPAGAVIMIAPDGTEGYVPQEQVTQAIMEGYRVR